jgi:hypothetical protein
MSVAVRAWIVLPILSSVLKGSFAFIRPKA